MPVKEYVLMLAGACIVCGGLTVLAPSGQFERLMRLVGAVFLTVCLISPIRSTWNGLYGALEEFQNQENSYVQDMSWNYAGDAMESTLRETIGEHVITVIGHHAQKIQVEIQRTSDGYELKTIVIELKQEDMGKAVAITDYIAMKTGHRPQVISE